jgi:hypothetical protein
MTNSTEIIPTRLYRSFQSSAYSNRDLPDIERAYLG